MNVSFIGAGNLPWHLAPALDNTDFPVREVYSLNGQNAKALVERLYKATVKNSLDFSTSNSRIFVISVSDDAIEEVVNQLVLPSNAILVHTSGSQPLSALAYSATPNTGVLYPLQTFTKSRKMDFREVPFFLESESDETAKVLTSMAKSLSKKVQHISSNERKSLHISAVFASNFTNHMLSIAKEILLDNRLDFEYLKPLIVETINKSLSIGPEKAQTGPARRGDLAVLDKHMEFLSGDEAVAEVYKVISQHIVDKYHRD
ncbi:MAG TPA: DUF2520 domain-containing protein [Chryseosolibacter sp.]|nr:DUF2520 domain-containing protein [Chryseosolibacter sp.]